MRSWVVIGHSLAVGARNQDQVACWGGPSLTLFSNWGPQLGVIPLGPVARTFLPVAIRDKDG
jgi:hypothetical protein